MFACTIDYSLSGEPYAEPLERIARREWQNGSAWRDVATTLPFETEAQAKVADNRLLGELVAAIDTGGKTKWTRVFECDDCGVKFEAPRTHEARRSHGAHRKHRAQGRVTDA